MEAFKRVGGRRCGGPVDDWLGVRKVYQKGEKGGAASGCTVVRRKHLCDKRASLIKKKNADRQRGGHRYSYTEKKWKERKKMEVGRSRCEIFFSRGAFAVCRRGGWGVVEPKGRPVK